MTEKLPEFPEKDDRSIGYHVAQTTLGAADVFAPGVGYALQQIVGFAVGAPLEKRREEWLRKVGVALMELQERFDGFDPSTLAVNEEFVSAVYETSHLAMKTHRETKRDALLNVVLGAAVGRSIDEILRGRFMTLLDTFSAGHIRVLQVLADPSGFKACVDKASSMSMGAQEPIIRAEITEQEIPQALFKLILSDLSREGLADVNMNVMGTSGIFLAKRSTAAGDSFIRFISSPLDP